MRNIIMIFSVAFFFGCSQDWNDNYNNSGVSTIHGLVNDQKVVAFIATGSLNPSVVNVLLLDEDDNDTMQFGNIYRLVHGSEVQLRKISKDSVLVLCDGQHGILRREKNGVHFLFREMSLEEYYQAETLVDPISLPTGWGVEQAVRDSFSHYRDSMFRSLRSNGAAE